MFNSLILIQFLLNWTQSTKNFSNFTANWMDFCNQISSFCLISEMSINKRSVGFNDAMEARWTRNVMLLAFCESQSDWSLTLSSWQHGKKNLFNGILKRVNPSCPKGWLKMILTSYLRIVNLVCTSLFAIEYLWIGFDVHWPFVKKPYKIFNCLQHKL